MGEIMTDTFSDKKFHKPAIARLKESIDPEGFKEIYKALIEEAEEEGEEAGQVCMPYIEEGDEFEVGTWVPELWFVVRKVNG
jgi:hypothetical protein